MEHLQLQLRGVLLLLCTVLSYCYGLCPSGVNITTEINRCLVQYSTYSPFLTDPPTALFTGADVEMIRTICQNYGPARHCLQVLRTDCPKYASVIDGNTEHVLQLDDLCTRKDLYESYAMHQTCFIRAKVESDTCYNTFRLDSDDLMSQAMEGKKAAVKDVCGKYDVMVSCIKKSLIKMCGIGAIAVVEDLIRPAIKVGFVCKIYDMTTTPPPTTTVRWINKGKKEPSYVVRDGRRNAGCRNDSFYGLTALLAGLLSAILPRRYNNEWI